MILSIIVIVFALGLAYMHWLQGAFTSAISFACALAGVLIAFGYYENVVNMMGQNGMSDYAGPMAIVVLFSVTYIVLRVVADSVVPGNISLNFYAEKGATVVFGLGAGILAAGTFGTAIQMMPLGVNVAGFTPYATETQRPVQLPAAIIGRQRGEDTFVVEELTVDNPLPPERAALLLPADQYVLGLIKTASAGAFSGSQKFADIHPDLPVEAFLNRVGPESSNKHVILNTSKGNNVDVTGIYTVNGTPTTLDTEDGKIRKGPLPKPAANDLLMVLRAQFKDPAAEKDGVVRITPAAVRLVVGENTYYPIGTMEGVILAPNRLDDLLPIPLTRGTNSADFVYALPKSVAEKFVKPADPADGPRFVEIKMFGRVDLTDKTVTAWAASKSTGVIRKPTSPLGEKVIKKPA